VFLTGEQNMKTIKELEAEMRFPSIETEAVLTQTREIKKLIDEVKESPMSLTRFIKELIARIEG